MNEEGPAKALTYEDYLEGTKQILEQSKSETEPYRVQVMGKELVVFPNVFSPKYFTDTELLASNLPVRPGEEMLEIGPGTGVISVVAVYKGARRVTAIDINPDAVANTHANVELHEMRDKIDVREGDVYDALLPTEKFDTIFWNTPWGFVEGEPVPDLEKAIRDPGYKSTERFIKEARVHLKENGRILIGFSSTIGRMDLLEKFVQEAGFTMHKIYGVQSTEIHPAKFEIFEAAPEKNTGN